MGVSPDLHHAIYGAPWGRRCDYHRAEDAERETRHPRHGAAERLCTEGHGRQHGAEIELTARSVGEPNVGAVPRAAMAVTAFVPGGDAPSDVDDAVALTLLYQRPVMNSRIPRWKCGMVWTFWRRLSITLLTMAPRRNVPRCCAISFFARTLMCYVGRCRVTHMHARSLGRSGSFRENGGADEAPA